MHNRYVLLLILFAVFISELNFKLVQIHLTFKNNAKNKIKSTRCMNKYIMLIYNNIYLLYTFMYIIVMYYIFYKIPVIIVFIGANT